MPQKKKKLWMCFFGHFREYALGDFPGGGQRQDSRRPVPTGKGGGQIPVHQMDTTQRPAEGQPQPKERPPATRVKNTHVSSNRKKNWRSRTTAQPSGGRGVRTPANTNTAEPRRGTTANVREPT